MLGRPSRLSADPHGAIHAAQSRGCSNGYIVMHRSKVEHMAAKHAKLVGNAFTDHCDVEFRKRVEYDYNWTALPSQCCPGRGTH